MHYNFCLDLAIKKSFRSFLIFYNKLLSYSTSMFESQSKVNIDLWQNKEGLILLAARNRVAMGARGLHFHPWHAWHVVGFGQRESKTGLGHVVFALFLFRKGWLMKNTLY